MGAGATAPHRQMEETMAERVYKKVELVGTSNQSYEMATRAAIEHARKHFKGLSWFEVVEQRGNVTGPEIVFQVTLKIGFVPEAE
jgi:dodecin